MRHLLFDLDDTLIDFQKAEKKALPDMFSSYGLPMNQSIRHTYRETITSLWEKLRDGEITRQELQTNRFRDTFLNYGLIVDGETMDREFRQMLGDYVYLIPNAEEVVKHYAQNFKLHIVTNGDVETQSKKIKASGLREYFDHVFISRAVGAAKPEKAFFETVLSTIGATPEQCTIIGDSLHSDILGGNQMGITTIWHNRHQFINHTEIIPTYEIHALPELYDIL